ncbi:MAG: penicillin-binding transpeptidase domain-containing protein, partial [Spirochaetales bacterium]
MKTNTFFSKPQFFICIAVLIAIAVYILVVYAKLAFAPQSPVIIQAEIPLRGSMFDRNKKPLAVQTDFYHLKVTPANVTDKNTFAAVLAPVTQLSEEEILNALNTPPARGFLYLKREIRETEKNIIEQEILKNKLRGISFDTVARRIYPEDALASQVIGFMGYDGYGLSGMELAQQDTFVPATGVPGESPVGNNVFLTIDANLQYKLEQIAGVAMENTQAESFMLVAASAKTGEVLSYISLPAANLNTYPSATEAEKIDRPAVLAYEPGSVFKIFSVAAFVDSGAISETERFVCDGRHEIITLNGERAVMTCLDHHGSITAREALQYSCNDALAQMSEKINTEEFLTYLREFGFGERTNVGLPSETRGSVKN